MRRDLFAELEVLPERLEVREHVRHRRIALAGILLQRPRDDALQFLRHAFDEARERGGLAFQYPGEHIRRAAARERDLAG